MFLGTPEASGSISSVALRFVGWIHTAGESCDSWLMTFSNKPSLLCNVEQDFPQCSSWKYVSCLATSRPWVNCLQQAISLQKPLELIYLDNAKTCAVPQKRDTQSWSSLEAIGRQMVDTKRPFTEAFVWPTRKGKSVYVNAYIYSHIYIWNPCFEDSKYRVDSSTLEVVVVVLSLALLEGKCGRAGSMVELITYDASDFYGMFFRGWQPPSKEKELASCFVVNRFGGRCICMLQHFGLPSMGETDARTETR